jgi:hypothetical protein
VEVSHQGVCKGEGPLAPVQRREEDLRVDHGPWVAMWWVFGPVRDEQRVCLLQVAQGAVGVG